MSKPHISLTTIVNLLKFGRFQSDLELIRIAREQHGRSGWNDKRVNGQRIKLGCRISDAATKFITDALVELFNAQSVVGGLCTWTSPLWSDHIMRSRSHRTVTAFWISNLK